MKKIIGLMILIILLSIPAFADNVDFKRYCASVFHESGTCPSDICWSKCIGGIDYEGCPQVCEPIPCFEILADSCPNKFCALLDGCNGQKVCYEEISEPGAKCGGMADPGQGYECCVGLEKRCGIEFFDGSCDMEGKNSVYSVALCVPCGNGICNQFENACNCPEDCTPPGEPKAEPAVEEEMKEEATEMMEDLTSSEAMTTVTIVDVKDVEN